MHAVVNFAPVLLEQVDDYAQQLDALLQHGKPTQDHMLNLLSGVERIPSDTASRMRIIQDCQRCHAPRMIQPYPAFHRLVRMAGPVEVDSTDLQWHLGYLSEQYFLDLLTWYHLAWLGHSLRQLPPVQRLMAQEKAFSAADRHELLHLIQHCIAGLIPRYRALAERGQIELSGVGASAVACSKILMNAGVTIISRLTVLPAQWGEDKNFNNVLDSGEDRDPAYGVLHYGWGTRGGGGWQTSSGGPTGGVWHTGRIDVTTAGTCVASGATAAQCQRNETVSGFTGQNIWFELAVSPEFEKVNQCPTGAEPGCGGVADQPGRPVYQVEFTNWAWNMSMDIPDTVSGLIYELDTDTEKIQPIDLFNDLGVLLDKLGHKK